MSRILRLISRVNARRAMVARSGVSVKSFARREEIFERRV